ncbi:type II toxin-antitoxin system VapC family toxin [Solicola gregarius]|uniref:Ribonuclease VapC n=1 Tax=Solicola gregarius TaxID=2908642 RepID=A0AA46TH19_9ACTN|nr:type II toxin-antitoxin system VapC family toxin [Solicola gregarius]UYM05043.1 type II toxin-antitoxin system VapC family toxin [Solicola gregarius]
MRVYLDSSALLKRVVAEQETTALQRTVGAHRSDGDSLLASSLAWIEVSRAIRKALPAAPAARLTDAALSGVLERPMTADVVALARRLDPPLLRSLDAIHLASSMLLDADVMVTYDDRLATACETHGIATAAPSDS